MDPKLVEKVLSRVRAAQAFAIDGAPYEALRCLLEAQDLIGDETGPLLRAVAQRYIPGC